MINKIFLSLISIIIVPLLISCNDSPTDLGTGFLGQDGVEVLKLDSSTDSIPQFSKPIKKVYSLGSSSQLLLGKADNVTAHSLLKFIFAIPDSILTELTANTLTFNDSWVELTKSYSFGDSNAAFDYQVFKINNNWTSSSFSADSFSTLTFDNVDISSNRTTENDTMYSFHLDPMVTALWLKQYADTSITSNYGILLTPLNNAQKILGFTAYNLNGVDEPRFKIVIEKPGAYIDTLVGFIASDISVVIGDPPNVGNENLAIQSSLTSEAKLFFDLSTIPDNIDINYASLTLTVDTLQTKTGSSFTNSLRVFLIADSTKDSLNSSFGYTLNRINATYTGEITNIVRGWKDNNISNQGMLIKATNEFNGVEIFVVKSSNAANVSERPKLEIVYSKRGKR